MGKLQKLRLRVASASETFTFWKYKELKGGRKSKKNSGDRYVVSIVNIKFAKTNGKLCC